MSVAVYVTGRYCHDDVVPPTSVLVVKLGDGLETVIVNCWVPLGETPLFAVNVIVPVTPRSLALGVPERTFPASESHAGFPDTKNPEAGKPDATIVYE
jgi:hypothetical protein